MPCPACALEHALAPASSDLPPDAADDETAPARPTRPGDTRRTPPDHAIDQPDRLKEAAVFGSSGTTPPTRRRRQDYWRYRRWSVAVFVAALAIYGTARLAWIHTNIEQIVHAHGDNAAEWYLSEYPGVRVTADARITHVNDVVFDRQSAPELILRAMEQREVRFTVVDQGQTRAVIVPSIVWASQWARLLVGIAIGALGGIAFALRPGGRSATGFAIFCTFIAVLWTMRAVPYFERFQPELLTYNLTRLYLPVAGLLFALTFSSLRVFFRRIIAPILAMVGACTLLVLLHLVTFYSGLVDPVTWSHYVYFTWAALLLAAIALLIPHKLWTRLAKVEITPTDTQRAWVVRFAVLLSFAPALIYTTILWAYDFPYNISVINELVLLIFPGLMFYAIFRHNLLAINDLLLESTLYGLALFALLLGYAAVTGTAANWLPEHGDWVRAGFVGVAATVAVPLHGRVRKSIDARLNRVSFHYDTLIDLLDELVPQSLTAEDFCQRAARIIGRSAQTSDVSIILRRPGQRGLTIAGISALPNSDRLITDCQVLIEDLEEHHSGYSIDDLLDVWKEDRRSTSSLKVLRDLRASMVMPLSSHQQFIGALLVGSRVDFRNYTFGELKTFRRLARHLAGNVLQILNRSAAITGHRIADIYPACPERIGRYVIDRILGEGGMGYVYRGRSSDGWAAIKVCNRFVQAHSDLMERFHREGIAMQRLDHPNIVQVLEVGWEGPEPYIATEYVGGGSLEDLVQREGPLDEKTALRYTADVARGLETAQENGIIHRDIKPRNLFVTEDDGIKIGDFGLARIAGATTLTEAGEVFGTPHYMAPEILNGEPADWRSDQYALGITLFYMLTKRHPFESESREALHRLYARGMLPAPSQFEQKVSEHVCSVVARMTQKSPENRFGTYADILAATVA